MRASRACDQCGEFFSPKSSAHRICSDECRASETIDSVGVKALLNVPAMSLREIARQLGVSHKLVQDDYRRALEKIRKRLLAKDGRAP